MTLLSFIIPVYNGEKYISRCIESILNLESTEIEVIAVNDGSADDSLLILKKYPITVINQDNSGVSAARNRGIKAATGKYITFVDADDYIDTKAFHSILPLLKQEEQVFMMGYRIVDANGTNTILPPLESGKHGLNDIHFLKRCLTDVSISKNHHTHYLGGKVYQYVVRTDLFKNISFPEGLPYAEDLCYCMQLFSNIDSLVSMNLVTYNYCVNIQSAMHSVREFFWEEYNRVFQFIYPFMESDTAWYRLIYWAGLGVINSYISSEKYTHKIPKIIRDPLFQQAIHSLNYDQWTFRERMEYKLLSNKQVRLWMMYKRTVKIFRKERGLRNDN